MVVGDEVAQIEKRADGDGDHRHDGEAGKRRAQFASFPISMVRATSPTKATKSAVLAHQRLGAFNTPIALAIATTKALLVAAIFMELR